MIKKLFRARRHLPPAAVSSLAALAFCARAFEAGAADLPKVTAVVPDFGHGAAAVAADTSHPFDRIFPASEPFELRVAAPKSGNVSGSVEIWPAEGEACAQPISGRQHYTLRMTPSGDAEARVLRAEVPALQVDQDFCVRFVLNRTPTDVELDGLAIAASDSLLAAVIGGGLCYQVDDAGRTAFETALKNATPALNATSSLKGAAAVALSAFGPQSRATCVAMVNAGTKRDALGQDAKAHKDDIAEKASALARAPVPGPQASPYVLLEPSPRAAASLVSKDADDATLASAVLQLAARAAQMPAGTQRAAIEAWSKGLSALRGELSAADGDAAKRAKAAKGWADELKRGQGSRLPPLPFLELFTGTTFVGADEYQRSPTISSAEVIRQLEAAAVVPNAVTFKKAVSEYAAAVLGQAEATKAFDEAVADVDKHTATTRAALLAALKSDATRAALAVGLSHTTTGQPGKGKTPAAANYAALDAGVAFAAPSGSDAQNVWVLPYLGLNLSAAPVDRAVKLGELVGDTFWQRASLTIGMTLTEPSLRGRSIHSVLFDNYPILAFGYRLTPFTRITGGAVFYWLDAANPASSNVEFHAAPFVGAALDIDVIHMLTKAKL